MHLEVAGSQMKPAAHGSSGEHVRNSSLNASTMQPAVPSTQHIHAVNTLRCNMIILAGW
jgi:hypothetical protein